MFDFTNLKTVAEPEAIADAQAQFPFVRFLPEPWTPDVDDCSGCPEMTLFGPLPAHAVLVYRWWGRWVRQPVGSCCLTEEIACLFNNTEAVSELSVRVLVFHELKVI